jgi:glycosyltransferase involved in cell wall biosynthesis
VISISLFSRIYGMLRRAPSGPPALVAIAAIIKDEAPYLLEWIAFHRVVGVERFFIADNGSADGTTEMLNALAAANIIERVAFPSTRGKAAQLPAYNYLMKRFRNQAKWFLFIDADEFLLPLEDSRSVRPLFDTIAGDVGCICVNWATYGSAGTVVPANALVIERFSMRAPKDWDANHHYKSAVRAEAYVEALNPHRFMIQKNFRYAHPDGRTITDHRLGAGISAQVVWSRLRLNHYVIKSKTEFELIKAPRGRVDIVTDVTRNRKFFKGHDRNEMIDAMPEWLIEATKAEMENLREIVRSAGHAEGVIFADRRINERVRALMAARK